LEVQTDQPGASPTRHGVFFEDINYGADGGLYPERVKNRAFEFPEPLLGWHQLAKGGASGSLAVLSDAPFHPSSPNYLRITADGESPGYGVANEGFFGMGANQGQRFTLSLRARAPHGPAPVLTVELVKRDGQPLARATFRVKGSEWVRLTRTIKVIVTEPQARLNLFLTAPGTVDVDDVSLFPRDTWKRRSNGLRADLVQWLAELKPAFLRFPGGCIVEGRTLATRYQWKNSIGKLEERRLLINRWNDEFQHRPAPDYFQTFGLGFYEYFLLAEDLGAEPMPILNCGMACQFNSGELVPLEELEPHIQDALDLIEFANGAVTSPWGARRAAMGHPRPFGLKLLGIGNEQWGPQYLERFEAFARVLTARHPEIQLIASAGPRPEDDLFHFLWPRLRELNAAIVDEHCYARPEWFLNNSQRYDTYDRSGPQVFMGEYAAQSDKVVSIANRNNWECALAEAAYLTGLERNSAVVTLAAYAPLFGHQEGWQWRPNLIWFNNLDAFGTPNYYVQQLFSRHRGDHVLPAQLEGAIPRTEDGHPRLYASATYDDRQAEVILKLVNATDVSHAIDIHLAGVRSVKREARMILLAGTHLRDENSFSQPRRIVPRESKVRIDGPRLVQTLTRRSLTVLRLGVSPTR
jgi:alpha-N-arabinofuranosidase